MKTKTMSSLIKVTKQREYPSLIPFISSPGMVLLPGGLLPFQTQKRTEIEATDLGMKEGRYIGVVQPKKTEGKKKVLFKTGCLGKITTFTEGADKSYFLIISGIRSFSILDQPTSTLLKVDYLASSLLSEDEPPLSHERVKLLNLLDDYLNRHNITVNWEDVVSASNESLVSALAMMCPFNDQEKQAILESRSLRERFQMLTAFLEISHLKKLESISLLN